jgi:putative Mg2+ transporter-C (MgtC) family protein
MPVEETIWGAVAENFTDLSGAGAARLLVRLVLAAALGGLLGWEREREGKTAGLRTHVLVALGSALFVAVPLTAGMTVGELGRVIQGLATGIGFVGGGAILKPDNRTVRGLTTAAGIWLTAAVGIAAGMGHGLSAILGAILAFLTLSALGQLEARVSGKPSKHSEGDSQPPKDRPAPPSGG